MGISAGRGCRESWGGARESTYKEVSLKMEKEGLGLPKTGPVTLWIKEHERFVFKVTHT